MQDYPDEQSEFGAESSLLSSEIIRTQIQRFPWQDGLTVLLMVVILAAGYGLRSAGRNWDDYTHLHPDERFLTDVASRIGNSALAFPAGYESYGALCSARYPFPTEDELEGLSSTEREYRIARAGRGGYFDAECSDLNPNNIGFGLYVYGEFPMYVTRITAETSEEIEYAQCLQTGKSASDCQLEKRLSSRTSYNGIHLIGRLVSSVADTLTILVIFLIGLHLFGRPQALIAASLYTFAAFPIQQSHFWTVDSFTTLWVSLSIYAAVNVLRQDTIRPALFNPLIAITAAFTIWILELDYLDAPSMWPLIIYGGAFLLVGVWTAQKNITWSMASGLVILIVFGIARTENIISDVGLSVGLALSLLIGVVTWLGVNKLAAFGGVIPWLMAAYCLWVYDGLAHYISPSLVPLALYLMIFSAGAVMASVLYQTQSRRWALILGIPLLTWVGICVVTKSLSWEGGVWSLFLVMVLATANFYGYRDYATFGIAFGAALASRVNIAPVVGLLFLAVIIRSLPVLDSNLLRVERYNLTSRAMMGLMIAGGLTILFFRLLNPHAFLGGYDLPIIGGDIGILPTGLNRGWLEDIGEAQRLVSGAADIPPNHQWANRVPWMFPGQNIVLYGLGWVLGLVAVAGLIWALWKIIRGRPEWTSLALPAAWIVAYFGWLGGNWVTSMRYFLPLYGTLCLLAAWLLVKWLKAPRLRIIGGALLVATLLYTGLYGYGMSYMHTRLLTRTAASLWFQENVSGDLGLWIEREDGEYTLQNIGTYMVSNPATTVTLDENEFLNVQLSVPEAVVVRQVVLHRATDRLRNEEEEVLRLSFLENNNVNLLPNVLGERLLQADLNVGYSDFGEEYTIEFDDDPENLVILTPDIGVNFDLQIKVLDGEVALSREVIDNILPVNLSHITIYVSEIGEGDPQIITVNLDDDKADRPPYTYYMPSQRGVNIFEARTTGVIHQLEIPHVVDVLADADEETLRAELSGESGEIAYGGIASDFQIRDDGISNLGVPVTITFDPPFPVEEGKQYTLALTSSSPIMTLGHVVATEGPWDDPMPYKVCPLPADTALTSETKSGYTEPSCIGIEPYGSHYYGLELYLAAEDDELKRSIMTDVLDQTDYLTISSNRFYDSLARIPYRWPLTMGYYDALFSGELGFELVHSWESYARIPELGLEWRSQFLPIDGSAAWLNEFEAEEAFHVYDHPAVLVFRKTADYDPQRTREILSTNTRQYKDAFGGLVVDEQPVNRNVVLAPDASLAPTGLMLPSDRVEDQFSNTWSQLYNINSWVNRNQWAAVAVWWILILLIGWATFPLLFAAFPALPDRGYAVSKLIGLLLIAWMAWFGASLGIKIWNQNGILMCLGIVAAISTLFAGRAGGFRAFMREKRLYIIGVEILGLALYLSYVYVRYRNPDLWHNSFGGEKPMDFAYYNAVLRSQTFPPLDPWFSGGYINYYYWGFVLVGAPVKILGIVPAVAYNLAIPTMFSMVGLGAFTIAHNVVAARDKFASRMPAANPWVAGISALLLVLIVGNLDTVRLFVTETAKLGGWTNTYDLVEERKIDLIREFLDENGRDPVGSELVKIEAEAANPPFYIQWQHQVTQWRDMTDGFVRGFDRIIQGDALTMQTHRWYWAPTRVIAELPEGKGHNAINEMPYFTFLYGDLHAHMMAMPIMLGALLWIVAEILAAGRKLRGNLAAGASLCIGGLLVGILRAVNTWDLPTFLILAIVGLTFAAWLTQQIRREEEKLPQPQVFNNLREWLDLRRALRLWWMPVVIFLLASLLQPLYFLINVQRYNNLLNAGLIPTQCLQISEQGLPAGVTLPQACEGNLEPVWNPVGMMAWGVGAVILLVMVYVVALVLFGGRFDRRAFSAWIGRLSLFLLVAVGTVAPFTYWYAGSAGLKPWEADRTPLWAYLDIHGLFIFILLSWLVWSTVRVLKRFKVADLYGLSLPVLLLLLAIPVLLAMSIIIGLVAVPVMLVTLPMIIWGVVLFLLPNTSRMERWIYVLMVLALGLTTGVEIVVLDIDIGRQNMVFKFYMQAWLLFGVSSGIALAWLLASLPKWNPAWRSVWQLGLSVLMTIALLYPIMATQARWIDRFDQTRTGNTLDGQAYMQYAVYGDNLVWYNFAGDYRMIQWINHNIQGTPRIIEAQTVEYKWGSRIAINTGLPTVLGWNWHQRQQRNVLNLNNVVWNRTNNVAAFYNSPDVGIAWNLINFYKIEYIILGVQERVTYNDLDQIDLGKRTVSGLSAGLAKFDYMVDLGLLEVVYESPTCIEVAPTPVEECAPGNLVMDKIYRVVPNAEYDTSQVGR